MKTRNFSRSWDHVNWWEPEHWKRTASSSSLEANPNEIRNGWLTLEDPKARFQQKQMAERELKIASLYEAQQARALDRVRHSPGSTNMTHAAVKSVSPPPLTGAVQPGKVRQMFEERRSKAGIDKSYPLQPIHNTDRQTARKPAVNGHAKAPSKPAERKPARTTVSNGNVSRKTHATKSEHRMNGAGDVNHNHEVDLHVTKHTLQSQPARRHTVDEIIDELEQPNGYRLEDETFPTELEPAPTPRTPNCEPKRPPRRNPSVKSNTVIKAQPAPAPVAPPRRTSSGETASVNRGQSMQKAQPVPSRKISSTSRGKQLPGAANPSSPPSSGAGAPCPVCGRRFASDRIAKHETICRKTQAKKRKPFDALKHRLAGTEAEPLISKIRKVQTQGTSSTKIKPLNSNWRKTHEEFINAIRAAKQVQAHISAGGKLSDLPPPPPSENPDYVQCPHCSRRFNQSAAERHIPKCATFQHNKPKPLPKRR